MGKVIEYLHSCAVLLGKYLSQPAQTTNILYPESYNAYSASVKTGINIYDCNERTVRNLTIVADSTALSGSLHS